MRARLFLVICVSVSVLVVWADARAHAQAGSQIPAATVIYCDGVIVVWAHVDGSIVARCGLHRRPHVPWNLHGMTSSATQLVLHDAMAPERDARGRIVPDSFVGTLISSEE